MTDKQFCILMSGLLLFCCGVIANSPPLVVMAFGFFIGSLLKGDKRL
jgi:hypothetical protein